MSRDYNDKQFVHGILQYIDTRNDLHGHQHDYHFNSHLNTGITLKLGKVEIGVGIYRK